MAFLNYISDTSLAYALSVTYLVIILVLVLLQPIYKRDFYKLMVYGYAINTVGMMLIAMRSFMPPFFSIILANTAYIAGLAIIIKGLFKMQSLHFPIKYIWFLLSLFAVIHLYFTYINENVNARIVNYSFFSILIIAYYLFKAFFYLKKSFRISLAFIYSTYLIYASYQIFRLWNALNSDTFIGLFRGSNILKGFLLLSIVLEIIRLLSLMFYHSSDVMEA